MTVVDDLKHATLRRHTAAWQIGTGVRLALAPGKYRVTGRVELAGRRYLELNRSVRIEAGEEMSDGEK